MKIYTTRLFTLLLILFLTSGFINNYSPATLSSGDDSTNNSRTVPDNSITSIYTVNTNISTPGQFTNSSSWNDIRLKALWKEIGNEVIIQIQNVIPKVEMYYGEITLDSGRRIAVILGQPDDQGKFTIKNTFGKFTNISIYTDSDLEQDK